MSRTPLVEMINIHKRFGGVHAVNGVSIDLYPGEVVGVLGHNGAGKTVLMTALSGAIPCDEGEIRIDGEKARIASPRDARKYGVETIYQTLALADNLDASGNLFLGRKIMTEYGTLNHRAMENETRKVIARPNPNFKNITAAVKNMSGGQR
jgi:D-xylose transport system ATP-binding protein